VYSDLLQPGCRSCLKLERTRATSWMRRRTDGRSGGPSASCCSSAALGSSYVSYSCTCAASSSARASSCSRACAAWVLDALRSKALSGTSAGPRSRAGAALRFAFFFVGSMASRVFNSAPENMFELNKIIQNRPLRSPPGLGIAPSSDDD